MYAIAILIGIYSYLILALGLLGVLYKPYIVSLTIFYIAIVFYYYRKKLNQFFLTRILLGQGVSLKNLKRSYIYLIGLIVLQAVINLIGALGPELGFDALWYHLTIPKIYLDNHSIFFIPGGLLYYSAMPKLTEMLYVGALALNGEILAKLIHFSFGILSSVALYKLSSGFFSPKISLVAVIIFYSNLVVGWQSTTAYVDLARTFFEIMALWGFIKFVVNKDTPYRRSILVKNVWLGESAVMLGMAISTKPLALGSLFIFSVLIISVYTRRLLRQGVSFKKVLKELFVYWFICLLIPLPWFAFSYNHTSNPIYPFFTYLYKVSFDMGLLNPLRFINETWTIFTKASDPISPVYMIFLPLVLIFYKKFRPEIKLVAIYSFLAIIIWYLTPRTDGGRFILPYLPAFSIIAAGVLDKISIYFSREGVPSGTPESRSFAVLDLARTINFRSWCLSLIILVSIVSIFYRGVANSKYLPVILGTQTKEEFLSSNLNFSFGDFYDTDGYFKENIKPTDKVLLYGFHNLYYVNFPFIDSSWVKMGDSFNYIAVQDSILPKRFKNWELIYLNPKTNLWLYSKGGIKWSY